MESRNTLKGICMLYSFCMWSFIRLKLHMVDQRGRTDSVCRLEVEPSLCSQNIHGKNFISRLQIALIRNSILPKLYINYVSVILQAFLFSVTLEKFYNNVRFLWRNVSFSLMKMRFLQKISKWTKSLFSFCALIIMTNNGQENYFEKNYF